MNFQFRLANVENVRKFSRKNSEKNYWKKLWNNLKWDEGNRMELKGTGR